MEAGAGAVCSRPGRRPPLPVAQTSVFEAGMKASLLILRNARDSRLTEAPSPRRLNRGRRRSPRLRVAEGHDSDSRMVVNPAADADRSPPPRPEPRPPRRARRGQWRAETREALPGEPGVLVGEWRARVAPAAPAILCPFYVISSNRARGRWPAVAAHVRRCGSGERGSGWCWVWPGPGGLRRPGLAPARLIATSLTQSFSL